jgi:hypothetical protein
MGETAMKNVFRELTVAFSSGCVGGLVNSLVSWFFGAVGITAAVGVQITPALTPPYLYQRMVWGGIWGFLLLLPILRDSIWSRGILLSLGPTIVQLFIVFPIRLNKGLMGLELGQLTPLFVVIYNAIWGIGAVSWMRWVTPQSDQ